MPGAASSYGPPDIAFDFFSTSDGLLTWQNNADLQVYSASIFFSGGTYVVSPISLGVHGGVSVARLRSWPVVVFDGAAVLGLSTYSTFTSSALSGEQRQSFPSATPSFVSTESYVVGSATAARHYTGGASNRIFFERAFLSTANMGL